MTVVWAANGALGLEVIVTPAPGWIGGEWVLADVEGPPPLSWSLDRFLGADAAGAGTAFVSSGRAALRLAMEALGAPGEVVLLPAYGCPALTQAALDAGATPAYYPGDEWARPRWDAVCALARRHRAHLSVVVHAFGLLQDRDAVRQLARTHGIAVIEDCSHTVCNAPGLTHIGPPDAAAAIASLRKLLPVSSGGVVAVFGRRAPLPPDDGGDAFAAARRAAFAVTPGPVRHRLLQRAEAAIDARAAAGPLPAEAAEGLRALAAAPAGALETWRLRCAQNREALARQLRATGCRPLHAALPAGTCPPGLVVRHPDRTRLAARLLAAGIEATLQWPVADRARAALTRQERLLAATLLTLPCDGRYGPADMERIAAACLGA